MKQLASNLPKLPGLPKLPKLTKLPQASDANSSLRLIRLRARTPRLLLCFLVVVLCVAGVRSIFGGREASAKPTAAASAYDVGAAAFAQSFTSVYMTWGPTVPESQRMLALKPFLARGIQTDAGLSPASGTTETVFTTHVAEETKAGSITNVLVVAQTAQGTQYVSVPVTRDDRGMLSIASYPALVGPPATNTTEAAASPTPVEDAKLETVVSRGLRNYLTGQAPNLRADLTPGAVVSLPSQPLTLNEIDSVGWLVPNHTAAVQVGATSPQGSELTLTYQVGVVQRDRWYIDSIQVDPTLKGGM